MLLLSSLQTLMPKLAKSFLALPRLLFTPWWNEPFHESVTVPPLSISLPISLSLRSTAYLDVNLKSNQAKRSSDSDHSQDRRTSACPFLSMGWCMAEQKVEMLWQEGLVVVGVCGTGGLRSGER